MNIIGKDCWNLIAERLDNKDLLNLRQTCKYMNVIVKNMNELWFRAHQWFLCNHSKSKVKSAVKVHTKNSTFQPNYCALSKEMEQKYNIRNIIPERWGNVMRYNHAKVVQLVQQGLISVEDCKCSWHWVYKVPSKRDEIPRTGYISKNTYIYYYLMECFRYFSNKHQVEMNHNQRVIEKSEAAYRAYMKASAQLRLLKRKYEENNVFSKKKMNTYKGI